MSRIELLMPCGSFEAFKQALYNGADAVYLGMKKFSARASSVNFSKEEYLEAINMAHKAMMKIYITINTLIYDDEFDEVMELIDFLYYNDVDALIIQDLGLLHLVKNRYPNLDIHVSTQMFVHNVEGIKLLKKYGVSRIVIARETPYEVIKQMCALDIEIEAFVYGALCTSYSGQCLISSVVMDRSANQGACSQMCRLPYDLLKDNKVVKNGYLLSLKDLNLIDHIDDLIKANVCSLKVEGRMKRSEYVGEVTRKFRKVIDSYYANDYHTLNEQDVDDLKKLFNRGFTNGYTFNSDQIFNQYRPNHLGVRLGIVSKVTHNQVFIKLEHDLNQQDGIRIVSKYNDYGLVCNKIYLNGLLVNKAHKGDTIALDYREKIQVNDIVLLTSDALQLKEINTYLNTYLKRRMVSLKIVMKINHRAYIEIYDQGHKYYVYGDEIIQKAKNLGIDDNRIKEQFNKINSEPFYFEYDFDLDEKLFISVNQLNRLRRKVVSLINRMMAHSHLHREIKEYNVKLNEIPTTSLKLVEFNDLDEIKGMKADYFYTSNPDLVSNQYKYINPIVSTNGQYTKTNLANSINDLNIIDDKFIIANYTMNVTNSYSVAFLMENNVSLVILSTELNQEQTDRLVHDFIKRYGFVPNLGLYKKGHRALMTMNYCMIQSHNNCIECNECLRNKYYLRNQNNKFRLMKDQNNKLNLYEITPFTNQIEHELIKNSYYKVTKL